MTKGAYSALTRGRMNILHNNTTKTNETKSN